MEMTDELYEEKRNWYLDIENQRWIPLEFMTVGWYLCDGRNLSIGWWNGKEFEYMRHKFGFVFPDTEYHWDTGAPYGTCKPLRYLGDVR